MDIVIQHAWSIEGPGGHYALLQFKSGPGIMDARSLITLGSTRLDMHLPIVEVIGFGSLGLILIWLSIRITAKKHETHGT